MRRFHFRDGGSHPYGSATTAPLCLHAGSFRRCQAPLRACDAALRNVRFIRHDIPAACGLFLVNDVAFGRRHPDQFDSVQAMRQASPVFFR